MDPVLTHITIIIIIIIIIVIIIIMFGKQENQKGLNSYFKVHEIFLS